MSSINSICPICEQGKLTRRFGVNNVEYKGQSRELLTVFSECDFCGVEQVSNKDTIVNKRAMVAFKKEVDGFLTGAQVKRLRTSLGLSKKGAADIFGGGPIAFSKYESDDVTQSGAMDKLLRCAMNVSGVFDYLIGLAQVGTKSTKSYSEYTELNDKWSTVPEVSLVSPQYVEFRSLGPVSNDDSWVPDQVMSV